MSGRDELDAAEPSPAESWMERAERAEHSGPTGLAVSSSSPDLGASAMGGLADAVAVLGQLLRDVGVTDAEVEEATEHGSLHMLALERLIALDPSIYTLDEAASMSGLDAEGIRAYWRALGFPDPRSGERLFSESDLDMLESVVPFIEEGSLDPGLAVQMARVIGSSLARIATAQIEAIERAVAQHVDAEELAATEALAELERSGEGTTEEELAFEPDDEALIDAARRAAELLPMMPRLMEFVWRRHLGAAARRQIMRAASETATEGAAVGFADLVGFTSQTQQLSNEQLAAVVDRFEAIAYDVIGRHQGRVVKTLGDEVMFLADDTRAAALIAIELAERYQQDEALSDVRVGLASGRVLERDGDVYGSTVNLAHRIVSSAYPGAVVVSPSVYHELEDDPALFFKSIRSHYLRDIGRVPLWTLRRAGDETEQPYSRARARRAARREFYLERRRLRQREAAELAGELPLDAPVPPLVDDDGDELEPTTAEYEALTDAVLDADIDPELQVELLADIEAAKRLHELEEEAQMKAEEADLEAERKLDQIEEEARRKVEQAEKEARIKVEAVLKEAEEKARRANEEASRKVKRVAEETERKADRAEKEAKREAKRKAARHKAERERQERAGNGDADGHDGLGDGPGEGRDGGPTGHRGDDVDEVADPAEPGALAADDPVGGRGETDDAGRSPRGRPPRGRGRGRGRAAGGPV